MHAVLAAAGGFVLAVLWMDLMFDVQVFDRSQRPDRLRDETLASIAGYYRRVTTDASPMSRLIAAVMIVMIGGSTYHVFRGAGPRWAHVLALVLCVGPITWAAVRIVPDAVTLGRRVGSLEEQSRLAHGIARAHILCFVAISVFVVLQVCGSLN